MMYIELEKPYSFDRVTSLTLLFRKNKKWGLLHDADGQIRLPQYECSSREDPDNVLLGIVFRLTGSFNFEIKPAFDYTLRSSEQSDIQCTEQKGRMYIVSLGEETIGAGIDQRLVFYSSGEIPDQTYDYDSVKNLLLHADIVANIYF